MRKTSCTVKLLYSTEDDDLILYCPQLAICGVCEGILEKEELSENMAINYFEKKLNTQIARFESQADFLGKLFLYGQWSVCANDIGPKPFDYFIKKEPFVQSMMNLPDIQIVDYTFEYTLEVVEQIDHLDKSIEAILGRY